MVVMEKISDIPSLYLNLKTSVAQLESSSLLKSAQDLLPRNFGYAAWVPLALVGLFVLNGLYNRYLHPLRNFPGPFWASFTDFYKLFVVAKMDAHTRGIESHKKYGPIVRVAPNLLAFSDPKLLPEVYHRRVDKTEFYSTGVLGDIPPPFQTLKHNDHAMKRKRIAPSFSMTNLRRFESEVDGHIQELCNIWREKFVQPGKPLDFACWAQWFVYDLVTQLGFGKPVGFVKQGKDVGGLIQCFHDMAPLAGVVAAVPWMVNPIFKAPLLGNWLMPKAGDGTGTGKIMTFRDEMLKDRLDDRKSEGHDDFLANLLKAKNPDGSLMSIEEVKTECFILMVAASDTTSAFICPFVNNVCQNIRVYKKLQAEIELFESQGKLTSPVPTFDETNKLPYFIACVKETLRFSPSTPMIMPRYVSKGGLNVNNTYIPEKTEMGANPYVIHRDTEIFGEDAEYFRPERWMESEDKTKDMDKYLMTFGYGTRTCLGKNIAQLETQKLCLQLFREFDIEIVNPEKPWRHQNWAISIYWDQWLRVRARQQQATTTKASLVQTESRGEEICRKGLGSVYDLASRVQSAAGEWPGHIDVNETHDI